MTWVYAIPSWIFAPVAIAVFTALSVAGLLCVRRYAKPAQITHNDVAGPLIATAGTVMAVLLSFVVVVVWQEYDASAANVQREASAIADLHRIADGLPAPLAESVRRDCDRYADAVVAEEWPAMRHGGRSRAARDLADRIEREIVAYAPQTSRAAAIQTQALELIRTLADSRRKRLFDNDQGIPPQMWAAMLIVAAITVGFTYLFGVDSFSAHVLMTGGLAIVLATIMVLIALLDYPFRGDVSIGPQAFVRDQAMMPTARAKTTAMVTNDVSASASISIFAGRVIGNVSAGLNASAFVNAMKR